MSNPAPAALRARRDGRLFRAFVPTLAATLLLICQFERPLKAAPPPTPRDAIIIDVKRDEIFIDQGILDGLAEGAKLEVFRRIELTHPITKKKLVDRFPIGVVTVAEAGSILSIIRDFQALSTQPQVGDFLVPRTTARTPTGSGPHVAAPSAPPTTATPCPVVPPPVGSEKGPLERLFDESRGLPPRERVALFDTWLKAGSDHPDAAIVRRERALFAALANAPPATATAPAAPAAPEVITRFPRRLAHDQPLVIYVASPTPLSPEALRVLVRRSTEADFMSFDVERDGRLGFRVQLPDTWTAPGNLFIRVELEQNGVVTPISGLQDQRVDIHEAMRDTVDESGRSRAGVRFDWVSFWMDKSEDYYLRIEGDFRYRVGAGAFEAFRIALGLFDGIGGPTDMLDAGSPGHARSVNYGLVEAELALHELFGASGRFLVGNFKRGRERQTFDNIFGGGLEVRLGKLAATRLYAGFQSTQEVGNEIWLRVAIEEVAGWPMEVSVLVTDLPVGADFGVSLGYGATWQISPLLGLSARVGWNARTINHSGFTLGTGMVLSW